MPDSYRLKPEHTGPLLDEAIGCQHVHANIDLLNGIDESVDDAIASALESYLTSDQIDEVLNTIRSDVSTLEAGAITYITGDTQYRVNVEIPTVDHLSYTDQLVTAVELSTHADHDAVMYQQMTDNIKTSIEASLTNYFTKAQTQALINQLIDQAAESYMTEDQVRTFVSQAIAESMLSEDQITSIVNAAIEAAGSEIVTKAELEATQQALLAAIGEAGGIAGYADSGVDPNGQYYLEATKYTNGQLIITGWVAKCGARFSAYFPDGFEFINTNYVAAGNCADDEAGLDNGQCRAITFGSLRTDSFTCVCARYEVSVLVGAAVADDSKYSVGFIGRWK